MTRDDVMRETVQHMRRVGHLMLAMVEVLQERALMHDQSKLSKEEFESFATATPKLKGLTYDSPEYRETLREIQPAVTLHYVRNRHHPEHHEHGIKDMTLIDLLEMLADWRAAGERHMDGDLRESIEKNAERFGYGDTVKRLLYLTAESLGWIP